MGRHRQFDTDHALDAAMHEFWSKGYEGTSYEDLSRATGVARPGLYSAFGNKEALFRKSMERYEAVQMSFMREALKEAYVRDVVAKLFEGYLRLQTLHDNARGCLGINGALACSGINEPIRQFLVKKRRDYEILLLRRLEQAKAEGELPPATDCATMSLYLMTFVYGLSVQAKAGALYTDLSSLIDHVLSTWLQPANG